MTDSTKIILIVGGILIITAYVLLYTPLAEILFVPKPKYSQPVRPMAPIPQLPVAPAMPLTREAAQKMITKEATAAPSATIEAFVPKFITLRDPFEVNFAIARAVVEPGTETAEQKPAQVKYLMLQGIFVSGDVKTAIIDDKVVAVGSKTAGGYKVSDIKSDVVVLRKAGTIKTLRMK